MVVITLLIERKLKKQNCKYYICIPSRIQVQYVHTYIHTYVSIKTYIHNNITGSGNQGFKLHSTDFAQNNLLYPFQRVLPYKNTSQVEDMRMYIYICRHICMEVDNRYNIYLTKALERERVKMVI